jgi:hypothetical protein
MTRSKKIVLSVAVVVAALAALGSGSYASYTAQTKNPNNLFATGALVLTNTKQGGTACLSTSGGATDTNVNNGCDQLLNLTVKKPGDSATVNLTVQNSGSLPATVFKVFSSACTDANAAAETYHGTGSVCSKVQLYIQQTDSAFTAKTACLYGGATVTNTCDFSDAAKTLTAFATAYTSSTTGLSIGSGLTAGASAYFTIGVSLPSTADNTTQGRSASIDLNWFAQQ